MRFGSLFAGIGGFDLGLERAGMECAWQVEIDPYARKVLQKHWPAVPKWDDVRTFPPAGDWSVDVICGGFPCQDISVAGKGAGIDGERSGLWSEYVRIIRELRPSYVIVENVAALLLRGIDRVLGDLAESGYDAEWEVIPACAFGLPHHRERVWIVAYPGQVRGERISQKPIFGVESIPWRENVRRAEDWRSRWPANSPVLCGVGDGIPCRVDRLGCLGNAVVPQIAEFIGRCLMNAVNTEG